MRTIRIGLNNPSAGKSSVALEKYRASVASKARIMLERLGQIGIDTIEENKGEYAPNLRSEKVHVEFDGGAVQREEVIMSQTGNVSVSWLRRGEKVTVSVSPLMMTEYGSGQFAVSGHRGTFPGQRHAFQPYWTWKDLDGVEHSSSGFVPKRPMHKARNKIERSIPKIARSVFSGW